MGVGGFFPGFLLAFRGFFLASDWLLGDFSWLLIGCWGNFSWLLIGCWDFASFSLMGPIKADFDGILPSFDLLGSYRRILMAFYPLFTDGAH